MIETLSESSFLIHDRDSKSADLSTRYSEPRESKSWRLSTALPEPTRMQRDGVKSGRSECLDRILIINADISTTSSESTPITTTATVLTARSKTALRSREMPRLVGSIRPTCAGATGWEVCFPSTTPAPHEPISEKMSSGNGPEANHSRQGRLKTSFRCTFAQVRATVAFPKCRGSWRRPGRTWFSTTPTGAGGRGRGM